jgi:hypothetical protein
MKVKVVDVGKCERARKECDDVRWTPTLKLGNQEI